MQDVLFYSPDHDEFADDMVEFGFAATPFVVHSELAHLGSTVPLAVLIEVVEDIWSQNLEKIEKFTWTR